jgi:undecaprenyl diphosphate synthase
MPEEIPSFIREESNRQKSTAAMPVHIGIIMDGNGRWARQQGKARTQGHMEGLEAAKRIVKTCADIGIKYLTLYAFSTENWKRTRSEVSFLMRLIKKHLKKEYDFYRRNRVRVVHCGDLAGLPPDVVGEIEKVTSDTARFEGLTANLAINYGGRNEIVRAVNRLLAENQGLQGVSEEDIRRHLDHPGIPDPDLIIRTGGEIRLSNFLLWELAYAEFYFSPKLWPDWQGNDLLEAIQTFRQRQRRFGDVRKS